MDTKDLSVQKEEEDRPLQEKTKHGNVKSSEGKEKDTKEPSPHHQQREGAGKKATTMERA